MRTGTIERLSVDFNGNQTSGASLNPFLSADGRYAAFDATSNLVAADTNFYPDVYRVPLFKDSAFGDALDLSLAGRYSDYSTFGGEFTPKYGLRWQVVDELPKNASGKILKRELREAHAGLAAAG